MEDRPARPEHAARKPRPVTPEWLFRAAVHYVERYATSTQNLRRVLRRKVERRARARGEDGAAFEELIEATVGKLVELKLVDDRAFAEAKLASLRRKGTSTRMAAAKLADKGVDRGLVDAVVDADATPERVAAFRYARRRRLGPHRLRERAERRERDVAAMMRAGFAYPLAAAAIDADPGDDAGSGEDE